MREQTIAQKVNERAARNNTPLSAVVEITYRCNQRCTFCYQRACAHTGDLGAAQWKDMLQQLAHAGTLYLTVTGGEPFVRDDVLDIIGYAREYGFAVSVITNGSLITASTARALADLSVMDVGVSFLASHHERHDRLCGVTGSFHKALETVRLLVAAGVRTMFKHTVTAANFGEYRQLKRLAEREGCLFECDGIVVPPGQGMVSPSALSVAQHREFLEEIGADSPACSGDSRAVFFLHCDAGRSVCGITPRGDVVPCIQLPISFGNLTDAPFVEIWHGAAAQDFREKEPHLDPACLNCDIRDHCSRCHGVAYLETGSWNGPSPGLCTRAAATEQIYRSRAHRPVMH